MAHPAGSARFARFAWSLAAAACAATLVVGSGVLPATAGKPSAQAPAPQAVAPKPPPKLLPNLRTLQASDLRIQVTQGRRYLRFSSAIANVGKGPSEVRPNNKVSCPPGQRHASQVMYRDVDRSNRFNRGVDTTLAHRSAGCMLFHAAHDHWHFDAAARYAIFNPAKHRVVSSHPKTSFCLRDITRVPANWSAPKRYAQFYGACSRDRPQGISIGWADVYEYYLAGQSLPLPNGLEDGVYCLRIAADPQGQLRETNDKDNRSAKSFRLQGNSVSNGPPRPCVLPENR